MSGSALIRRIEAAIRLVVHDPDIQIIEYRYAYHPICPVHGERPFDVGPHSWQAVCDVCGALGDAFQPRLERVTSAPARLGPPHLIGTV